MRRFETDYAGAWRGHCNTLNSAIQAATRKLTDHGMQRATITDKLTGQTVVRLTMSHDRRSIHIESDRIIHKLKT